MMPRRLLPALLVLLTLPAAADAGFAGSNGKVAYVGKLGGATTLIVRDGRTVEGILDGGVIQDPAWSPQGRRLAVVRGGAGGKEIWAVDHDGRGLRQVTRAAAHAVDPAWAPSGAEIAYASAGRIHAVSADGSTGREIAEGGDPAWSSRGTIAFTARGNLFAVTATGGTPKRLTKWRGSEHSPAWSPDGRRLAFVRGGDLWVADADGRRARRIANGPLTAPAWAPDGTRLVFSAGPTGRRRILSVRSDGSVRMALSTTGSDGRTPDQQPIGFDPVIAAAGDIACDPESKYYNGGVGVPARCGQLRTSNLLLQQDLWQVLPLGDNQYQYGELADFMASYDPTWGRTKHLQRPVIGNHEYATAGTGHFDYFNGVGALDGPAGDRTTGGYYSFDVGTWHVVALNSECDFVPGGCELGSPQQQWLASDLAANPQTCTMAIWHTPRYSSYGGGAERLSALWDTFAGGGGDVVLTAHHHFYERMAPIDGVREFIVGTGGGSVRKAGADHPSSVKRIETTLGILRMTLRTGAYDWRFQSASADPATDAGTGTCA